MVSIYDSNPAVNAILYKTYGTLNYPTTLTYSR